MVIEQRPPMKLGGDELDAVPARQSIVRDPHRRDRSVMTDLFRPVPGQPVDLPDVRLVGRAGRVLIRPEVRLSVVRLGVLLRPGGDLVGIDVHAPVVDPRRESVEALLVRVRTHTGAEAVVPTVQTAHEVVAVDVAIGHQRAAMQASAVHHRDVVVEGHDHQVDIGDQRAGGRAILEVVPVRNWEGLHRGLLSDRVTRSVRAELILTSSTRTVAEPDRSCADSAPVRGPGVDPPGNGSAGRCARSGQPVEPPATDAAH